MKRKMTYGASFDQHGVLGLLICAVCFACGIAAGTLSAQRLDGAGAYALRESMLSYMEQIRAGTYLSPGFLSVLWTTGRDHLIVVFLGFSLLGAFCLPILSGVRGFYLSFPVAAFIRVFGAEGLPVALSLFGVGALFTLPTFLVLATQAFSASAEMGRATLGGGVLQAELLYGRPYLQRLAICFLGILAAVLTELYLTPTLVSWTSSFL